MGKYLTLSPDQLIPPVVQMRDELDPVELAELTDSIRRHGLRQPLLVTRAGEKWQIVAGYRRWRACQDAGVVEIPCIEDTLDEYDQVVAMAEENLQRVGTNPLEEARVFAILREARDLTIEGVARIIGKSPSYVGARLSLLDAPRDIQDALRQGLVSMSVAHQLARIMHDDDRAFYLYHAQNGGATTDTVRRWVDEALERRATRPAAPAPEAGELAPAVTPQLVARCEWCRRESPWERVLTFQVDRECYTELVAIRKAIEAQEAGQAQETPAPAGGGA